MNIQLFKVFLCYLFILLPLYCTKPATAETYPNRISLAISGGASKGAYEAGLIWGLIEVLRQVEKTENWAFGGEPRPIEIATIAGTSAGGINTLLAALVWSVKPEDKGGFTNRINDNIFRDVWLTPDVNRLLPPNADPRKYLPDDALLSRNDLVEAARELRKKWRQPGTFRPGLRLPLGVTVTRVKPETLIVRGVAVDNQRFYIPFELRTQADGSVKFFFDPHDYPSLADPAMIIMPWPADGSPFFVSDQQVETALLTTSAFPTGFGRKRLQYCRQKTTSKDDETTTTPSMEGSDTKEKELVCPDGYEITEAEFADEYHTQWHDYMAMIRSERWTAAFEDRVLKSSPWPESAPFVITLNDRNTTEIRTTLIELIKNARESVIIEHAYFSDDKIIEAVKRVAANGIQVNIILPKKLDTHHYANMVTINKLIQSKEKTAPRVFLYPQMMHAKVVLTDGVIASVGSANLTPRSMKTSREVTMFVHGNPEDPFIKRLRERLEADLAESEEVLTPFKLGIVGKIKAFFGKYLW